jgi:hypothetical protein
MIALAEAARVLKPGGFIGLTFDYGPAAPGANEYLLPPHDPPANTTEVLYRYAREGLVVVGNPFSENPQPGALFHDDVVSYTVASLFLAKPPSPEIREPQPEAAGTALANLTFSMLPAQLLKRERVFLGSTGEVSDRIAELERMAEERLSALHTLDRSYSALRLEGEMRESGLRELTAMIAARDQRIAELERVAEERLSALHAMDRSYSALRGEADARESGLHELTALIAARDQRIAELERMAEERLSALQTMDSSYSALRREAEARESGLHELIAVVAARDQQIAELERISEVRSNPGT